GTTTGQSMSPLGRLSVPIGPMSQHHGRAGAFSGGGGSVPTDAAVDYPIGPRLTQTQVAELWGIASPAEREQLANHAPVLQQIAAEAQQLADVAEYARRFQQWRESLHVGDN